MARVHEHFWRARKGAKSAFPFHSTCRARLPAGVARGEKSTVAALIRRGIDVAIASFSDRVGNALVMLAECRG